MNKKQSRDEICVTNMHTGGEPARIITSGYPKIEGETIIAKKKYCKENLDEYRTMVMFEPRGHYDQFGALLVEPDLPEADVGVIFLHNDGYGNMCGHATIALGRYIVDNKLMKTTSGPVENGVVSTNIQAPCGLLAVEVEMKDGQYSCTSFTSVPAFLYKADVLIDLPSYGQIKLDISYGGVFYALVDANQLKIDIETAPIADLIKLGTAVSEHIKKTIEIKHPTDADLSYFFGTILTDGKDLSESSKHLCIFADRQVDRSPCGSGTTARIAAQFGKGQVKLNEKRSYISSRIGSKFDAEVVCETTCGTLNATRVKISGQAYYTGTSKFFREDNDPLRNGFLIR